MGSGSFGAVYAVTKNGEKVDKNGNQKIYAMKIIDKSLVLSSKLARYTLTEKNVFEVGGSHPLIIGLEYAF